MQHYNTITQRFIHTMKTHIALILLILVSLTIALSPQVAVRGQDNLITSGKANEIWQKIESGWRQLEQIDNEPRCCDVLYRFTDGKGEPTMVQAKLAIRGNDQLFAGDRQIYAKNRWYGFLIRPSESASNEWALGQMLKPEEMADPSFNDITTHPLKSKVVCFFPMSAYGIGGARLASIIADQQLTTETIEDIDDELLSIRFFRTR
jgi:hypothetical protein